MRRRRLVQERLLGDYNADGIVDAAVYSRPHIVDDETVSFVMAENRSYANVTGNPSALYLFHGKCDGPERYDGVRLTLEMLRISDKPVTMTALRRHHSSGDTTNRHLVYFKVVEVRPLVGDEFS